MTRDASHLRLGVPSKGRLSDIAVELLRQGGLSFRRQDRSLFALVRELPIEVIYLRTDDIPVLCAEGAIDMGITGSDLVVEAGVEVAPRLSLGVGHCRLAVCVPIGGPVRTIKDLAGCRIATSFPRATRQYLAHHHIEAHLVEISGSVEIMIALDVAEAVVDLVESGSTLAANRLTVLDDISQHETVLIQGPHCQATDLANRITRRLEGVVIARSYSLLEYNVPRTRLADAERITPGFRSPTVSQLEDSDWCAVRVMVRRSELVEAMDRLESIGASAILETMIHNCRL